MAKLDELFGRHATSGFTVHIDERVAADMLGSAMADKGNFLAEEIVDPWVPTLGAHDDHRIDTASPDHPPECGKLGVAAIGSAQKQVEAVVRKRSAEMGDLIDEECVTEGAKVAGYDQADRIPAFRERRRWAIWLG